MNGLVKLVYTVFMLLLVAGCNTMQTRSGDASALSRIQQRGELVVGTSANMPPMTYARDDDKVVGLDIDLARFMASAMDVKLTIKTLPFTRLLPALEQGDVDIVLSNMTMTSKRNMRVAFVGPYMRSGKCIITKEDSLAKAEKAEDLNTPRTRIVVIEGTTSEDFVTTLLPQATVMKTEDRETAIKMVSNNEVGGMLTDFPICLSTLKNYPDAGFVSLFSLLNYEPIGIALPGNDALFVNWTENFMKRLDETGILDEIGQHWFGQYGDAIRIE